MSNNRCVVCRGKGTCEHCGRGDNQSRITLMRRIVERHTAAIIERSMVDAFSASAYIAVHDALSPPNQMKLEAMPLTKAINIVWKLVK